MKGIFYEKDFSMRGTSLSHLRPEVKNEDQAN